MNKEVIIDGVDVSGCKLRIENNEMACFVICKEYPDCYYKQLQRVKAENERLKQGIKHYQRGMYKIISVATECRNSKQWNYKGAEDE